MRVAARTSLAQPSNQARFWPRIAFTSDRRHRLPLVTVCTNVAREGAKLCTQDIFRRLRDAAIAAAARASSTGVHMVNISSPGDSSSSAQKTIWRLSQRAISQTDQRPIIGWRIPLRATSLKADLSRPAGSLIQSTHHMLGFKLCANAATPPAT